MWYRTSVWQLWPLFALIIAGALSCAKPRWKQYEVKAHTPSVEAGRALIAAEGNPVDIVLRLLNPNATTAVPRGKKIENTLLDLYAADPHLVYKLRGLGSR